MKYVPKQNHNTPTAEEMKPFGGYDKKGKKLPRWQDLTAAQRKAIIWYGEKGEG